jgi:hypothetical protein
MIQRDFSELLDPRLDVVTMWERVPQDASATTA